MRQFSELVEVAYDRKLSRPGGSFILSVRFALVFFIDKTEQIVVKRVIKKISGLIFLAVRNILSPYIWNLIYMLK